MMLEKWNKSKNFIELGLIGAIFLICLLALHDMQTAEGVGLFFTFKLGKTMEQRMPLDLLVDVVGMVALALLIYLPCCMSKRLSVASYLRLLIGYLAMVPTLSLAEIISLFSGERVGHLWDMGILWTWEAWTNIYKLLPLLQVWVPLFILLYGFVRLNQCFVLEKWHKIAAVLMLFALVLLFIIPAADNLLLFLIGYMGLLLAFDCWERLYVKLPEFGKWCNLLFVAGLFKGIYRIVVLMSQY